MPAFHFPDCQSYALLAYSHAARNIGLAVSDQVNVTVFGDRDQLSMAIHNLVENAINYSPENTKVSISTSLEDEIVTVSVADQGIGIPESDLERIFERFYRAEKSRTRSAVSGFGLGLAIAHWIVEAHGGRIEVNSQEGKGTTFAVWIPLVS